MRSGAILMGIMIFWGLTSVAASAQDKTKPEKAEPSSPAAMAPSEEFRMGGIIIAIDPARHKVLIQQYSVREEKIVTLSLDREGIGKVSAFRKGDVVNIWVKGNRVMKIEKIPDPVWEENRKEGK